MAFISNELRLSEKQKDGGTLRQHLEAAQQQGAVIPELEPVPLPVAGRYLWEWFMELGEARNTGGFGASPISYADIGAWRSETGVPPLLPYELAAIRAMDRAVLAHYAAKAEAEMPPPSSIPRARGH